MGRKDKDIAECELNPEKFYKTPAAVLSDNSLTQEQKDKILHCWEQEEIALMRADGENMTPQVDVPPPAEVMDKIKDAEKKLENSEGKSA
jgi:hypothetical protein